MTTADSSASATPPSTLGKEVRASGRERTPPTAAGGRGERPTQMPDGRSLARKAHVVRGPAKIRLRPARRRELAH